MLLKNAYKILYQPIMYQNRVENIIRFYANWHYRKAAKVLLPYESNVKSDLKKEKVIDLSSIKPRKRRVSPPELTEQKSGDEVNTKPNSSEIKTDLSRPTLLDENDEIVYGKLEKDSSKKFIIDVSKKTDVSKNLSECDESANKKLNKKKRDKIKVDNLKTEVFDENGEIVYEKLKDSDGRISTLFVKVKSKNERMRNNLIMVEGLRLIADGLEAQCPLKYIIFSQKEDLNKLKTVLPKTGVTIFKIPYKEIKLFSNVETSPGILGIFETPTPKNVKIFGWPLPLQLICDNVRVPGNLGAILRAAVGAGVERVLLTKGCVDLWDPKVVRSAAGAHFRIPIHHSLDWDAIRDFIKKDTSIFIADSETNNLADSDLCEEYGTDEIPVLPYYGMEFSASKNITLIIGGETEGISEESYRLALSHNGLRLNVPLHKGVDSLNTGMAFAVIAFEIRKQLLQSRHKKQLALSAAKI